MTLDLEAMLDLVQRMEGVNRTEEGNHDPRFQDDWTEVTYTGTVEGKTIKIGRNYRVRSHNHTLLTGQSFREESGRRQRYFLTVMEGSEQIGRELHTEYRGPTIPAPRFYDPTTHPLKQAFHRIDDAQKA